MRRVIILPLIFLASFLYSGPAGAAKVPSFCTPVNRFAGQVEHCGLNHAFASQATNCQKNLNAAVSAAVAAAEASLRRDADAQKHSFRNSGTNFNLSAATLELLIQQTQRGIKDLESYLDNLVYPEDADSEEIAPDLEAFLASVPCYIDNQQVVEKALEDFEKKLEELKAAKAASLTLENSSSGRETNTGSLAPQVNVTTGGHSAPVVVPGAARRPSDISGTEKKKNP